MGKYSKPSKLRKRIILLLKVVKNMRRKSLHLFKFAVLLLIVISVTVITYNALKIVANVFEGDEVHVEHPRHGAFFGGPVKNAGKHKIDWHDYKLIEEESKREGIGEHGVPGSVPPEDEEARRILFSQNGFDGLLSDRISLHRSVPDIRHQGCKKKTYLSELPTVSVIVPFHDEHFSTLLRTCYSVLDRSPKELIVEIILVDDFSEKEFLKRQLDDYVQTHLPKVKIVRLPERSGLITARLAGAKIATGDVLIFLDSHTEANVNWLPPLLEPIAENYRVCVCPFIDVIDHDTFEYRAQDEGARGAFDWQFYYKRLPLLPEDLERPTEPFKSPVMAGGLFAISAKFFWELGGYDEGLDIWGGEQYELSFKIWQCGGEMVDAPCSRVGHVYRGKANFKNPRTTDYVHKNYKRVAEVWMDEYKEYLYDRSPNLYKRIDAGDLTKQKALRERLKCKSFKWFMEEVAFDLPKMYPPVEPPDYASGAIQSVAMPSHCIDSLGKGVNGAIGLYYCAEDKKYPQFNQFFVNSWHKDIRGKSTTTCWDVSDHRPNTKVILYDCHGHGGNQLWHYEPDKQWVVFGTKYRCLDMNQSTKEVFVNDCDESKDTMKWKFGSFNATALTILKNEMDSGKIH